MDSSILLIVVVGIGGLITIFSLRVYYESVINPCPNGYSVEETQTVDNTLYYRCCKSRYEISGNKFKEVGDCQILKAKPSLWEEWFG